jgi:hypothetical protein
VQNNIYRILGEFALNRGAVRVNSDDAFHIAEIERELVCLRLLKEQRAIYCAVHNVKNDQDPESFVLLSDDKTAKATDEIYTRLAHYTKWLMVEYADDADRK